MKIADPSPDCQMDLWVESMCWKPSSFLSTASKTDDVSLVKLVKSGVSWKEVVTIGGINEIDSCNRKLNEAFSALFSQRPAVAVTGNSHT